MKTQTDPKVDYAFKHVFGREESKPALLSLLNAVSQPGGGPHIASLELLSPFNAKETANARLCIVDIKARDETGRMFNIEMQIAADADLRQRALYYWTGVYRDQLHRNQDYHELRPTIAVWFVDALVFSDLDDYHLTFELLDRRHLRLFTDQMALHILELPKFNKPIDELTTDLDRWLYFLRHGAELDSQAPPEPLNTPEVRWAIGDLFMISQTDPEREIYEARLRVRREAASQWRTARAEGRAEGREEGRAEGRDEGRAEGREEGRAEGREEGRAEGRSELLRQLIQPLQKALGREATPSEKLRSLSTEELENAWAELQAELPKSQ